MKKALSLFLAVLMIFSVCGATLAFAADGTYTVTFVDYDNSIVNTVTVADGNTTKAPENPSRENVTAEDGTEYEYIFKGWAKVVDGKADESVLYHETTIPAVTEDVTYIAVYSEQEVTPIITFWNLVESIFARLNMIFEYFAKVFFGDK